MASPPRLLVREQLCQWNRSAQFKGMLRGTPMAEAKQSPHDADTDGDLPLMPGGEGWPRSPALLRMHEMEEPQKSSMV